MSNLTEILLDDDEEDEAEIQPLPHKRALPSTSRVGRMTTAQSGNATSRFTHSSFQSSHVQRPIPAADASATAYVAATPHTIQATATVSPFSHRPPIAPSHRSSSSAPVLSSSSHAASAALTSSSGAVASSSAAMALSRGLLATAAPSYPAQSSFSQKPVPGSSFAYHSHTPDYHPISSSNLSASSSSFSRDRPKALLPFQQIKSPKKKVVAKKSTGGGGSRGKWGRRLWWLTFKIVCRCPYIVGDW